MALILVTGVVEGWVLRQERRLSESLNAGEVLHVKLATETGEPGAWADYLPEDVMAVAASPRRHPSPRRVSRRRQEMTFVTKEYRLSGTAHIPIGADPDRYTASALQRWLPLTQCTVTTGQDSWRIDVLLVNLDRVDRVRETDPGE